MPDYRQLHEDSLRQNRPEMYAELKKKGQLRAHLNTVQQQANELHDRLRKDLAAKQPYNPVDWKNSREAWEGWLDRTAQEIVLHDRVLVKDAETQAAMRDGYTD